MNMTKDNICPYCGGEINFDWDKGDFYCDKCGRKFKTEFKWRAQEETGLKPCPFCGGNVEIREEYAGRDETYAIHCMKCDMHFSKFVWVSSSKDDITKEWNRRVDVIND